MILVVSSLQDDHATAVLAALQAIGAPAAMVDLAEFPQQTILAMQYAGSQRDFWLVPQNREIPAADCGAVWWRRPQAFSPHPEIRRAAFQNFVYSESQEAFSGFWQALDAAWMNHPSRDEVAARKALQLKVAQECGLRIPQTLITNDPVRARRFAGQLGLGRIIYKSFSATEDAWRETRLLRAEELALIDSVRYAPVIFQEYIEAEVDLRVTVVGDQIFAAAIYSQESSYKIDFRIDMGGVRIEPAVLPEQIAAQIKAFMSTLGIVYGAIDMRRTPDGQHVFLEVNPSGQWRFVEARTSQPITAAVAAKLAELDQTTRFRVTDTRRG